MKKMFFYSNVKYLIDNNYQSIYSFIKENKQLKQNTLQDYYHRENNCASYPKFENVIIIADIFNLTLDDLIYNDLSSNESEWCEMMDDYDKKNRFDCKILTYKLDRVNYKKIESDIESFCNESTWEYRSISQLSTTVDSNHNLYIVNIIYENRFKWKKVVIILLLIALFFFIIYMTLIRPAL